MASLTPGADIIIVACSQDATSRGFVNAAFLSACKAGVIIVNVARGETHPLSGSWAASLLHYGVAPEALSAYCLALEACRGAAGLRGRQGRAAEWADWASGPRCAVGGTHGPTGLDCPAYQVLAD